MNAGNAEGPRQKITEMGRRFCMRDIELTD